MAPTEKILLFTALTRIIKTFKNNILNKSLKKVNSKILLFIVDYEIYLKIRPNENINLKK